jgi:predicted MFS family arabinose efflux permease
VGVCGFGSVVMPLLVGKLLEWYGPEGTMLIMAGLILHCLPASLLLQPVRWHMIKVPQKQQLSTSQTTQLQVQKLKKKKNQ